MVPQPTVSETYSLHFLDFSAYRFWDFQPTGRLIGSEPGLIPSIISTAV